MPMPEAKPLPYGLEKVPSVFIGDDAFALKKYMMKPYPQRNITAEKRFYNYQHSRPDEYQKICLESLQIDSGYFILQGI